MMIWLRTLSPAITMSEVLGSALNADCDRNSAAVLETKYRGKMKTNGKDCDLQIVVALLTLVLG